jgi:FkbM family methyltransferase
MITFKHSEALHYIKEYLPANPTIVEAGAFDGKETIKMAMLWPQGTLHSFEPVPEIFEKLKKNTELFSNVHCHPVALSDSDGTATLYVSEKPQKPGQASQANSLLKPKERLKLSPLTFPKTIEVPTIILDHWAEQNNVAQIDFLWLDMQGYELNVLKSSPKTLAQVSVVYTEVEFVEAYEGQYQYNDVKTWLEENGFKMVGKDFDDSPSWFFGNCLFIKKVR